MNTKMNEITMKELNLDEMEQVNGGSIHLRSLVFSCLLQYNPLIKKSKTGILY